MNLDPTTTALVLIDLQHGIVGRPLEPRSGTEVATNAARLAAAFRARGATVIYVHVILNEVAQLPADRPRPAATNLPPNAFEIVPEAGMHEGDLLVTKRQWGAFYGTDLDQLLRRRGIRTIVLGGIATNFGVESTARAAFDRGYALVFAEDAMTSPSTEMHRFTVENLFPIMGHVRSADEISANLR
jgi:nicotinamidase-related amidase